MQAAEQALDLKELVRSHDHQKLIIAGPCSAETEAQLLETAAGVATHVHAPLLRAGIWKPRTRPGSFEGIGKEGLPWLQKARSLYGLKTAVEVANPIQVEQALAHDVDVLWIGARTTVNPFSVQDIADSLAGVQVPVLIKNPVNADLELWVGAVERIAKAGINQLGLIHRGFSSYGNTQYRNAPMWNLAIEMKRRHPEQMMICDPSHICGRRDSLARVMQQAIDLDYDGLIVETHRDPDAAWSDAKQQITPEQLAGMLAAIQWRVEKSSDKELLRELEQIRIQIRQMDDEVLSILGDRMKLAEKIGSTKKEHGITILQTQRWNDMLKTALEKSRSLNLSREFITRLYDAIHMESIRHQNEVMND